MTRDQVIHRLAEARAELAGLGVRSLDVFGSVARGEAGPSSDVDLLVEFDKPIGLFHFFRVQRRLEEILGCRVDLVMRGAVKPQLRARIFAEAVRATWGVAPPHRGSDDLTLDAVSHCFGIIGEAAANIPRDVVAAHPEIPWVDMRAMRNVVVHDYFGVTNETLWKTAREDLPTIVEPLRKLLAAP